MDENLVRQEIHCHHCDKYVQFEMDMGVNGNHVLECPNCGHEHCRVVKDGEITGERWGSRNGGTVYISGSTMTTTVTSVYTCMSSTTTGATNSGSFLADSWLTAYAA